MLKLPEVCFLVCLIVQETGVWSLGGEDPLEKRMATHSSILAWKFQGQRSLMAYIQSMGSQSQTWPRDWHYTVLYAQVGTWTHTRCVYSLSYIFTVKEVLTLAMCLSLLQIEWDRAGKMSDTNPCPCGADTLVDMPTTVLHHTSCQGASNTGVHMRPRLWTHSHIQSSHHKAGATSVRSFTHVHL